jgi:methylase of polypeptide subunit release factors
LPHPAGQFDILVTSPPYLPAASGRESYARARALSLIALGMAAAEDVDDLAGSSIGAMDPSDVDLGQLTPAEGRLVSWLAQDPLRQPKAGPTARYFLEMRRALAEMHRVLAPGGRCALVSGRQSTFYRFSTRQVLQVAHSAEYLAEESLRAGFDIRATHDLQLAKGNLNARPRSLDDYYETIIIMVKPG